MNGLPRFIAEQIPITTRSNAEMGLPEGSGWEVTFTDGAVRTEQHTSWDDMSEDKMVDYFGMKKQIKACKFPVKRILVKHEGLEVSMEVPEGCQVYQAVRSEFAVQPNGDGRGQILGRSVGLVRDGNVIEERFLSGIGQEILGMRV